MKRKILLIGLSAFALASCGLKTYKNGVVYEDFLKEFQKIAEENSILNPEKIYSYTLEVEGEGKNSDVYLKDDKKMYEEVSETTGSLKYEFDSENCVCKVISKSEEKYEDASSKKCESADTETVYQADDAAMYTVDLKSKSYDKTATTTGKQTIEKIASTATKTFIASFAIMAQDSKLNFFIDDNVYTIEEKINEEEDNKTKNVLSVFQFILLEDGYDYYEETSIEIIEPTVKTLDKETRSVKLRRKDVSLKTVDLSKYLERE